MSINNYRYKNIIEIGVELLRLYVKVKASVEKNSEEEKR